jgi:hypothetical protein
MSKIVTQEVNQEVDEWAECSNPALHAAEDHLSQDIEELGRLVLAMLNDECCLYHGAAHLLEWFHFHAADLHILADQREDE